PSCSRSSNECQAIKFVEFKDLKRIQRILWPDTGKNGDIMAKLFVSDHPLVQDKLARLRDKATNPQVFRRLMAEVAMLIGCEVLKGVRTRKTTVQTPLKTAPAVALDQPLAFVAVL